MARVMTMSSGFFWVLYHVLMSNLSGGLWEVNESHILSSGFWPGRS